MELRVALSFLGEWRSRKDPLLLRFGGVLGGRVGKGGAFERLTRYALF